MRRAVAQHEAVARALRLWRSARVSGGGVVLQLGEERLRLSCLLGCPLASFYEWPRPLGRPQTCPKIWASLIMFWSPETYSKTASFWIPNLTKETFLVS